MEIVKAEHYAPTLRDSERAIVEAHRSKALCLMETSEIAKTILSPFKELYLITGHKPPSVEDSVATIKILAHKLKKTYPNTKINEVTGAMRSGAYGDFGDEVVYVSPKSIIKWVADYNAKKHEALRKQKEFEKGEAEKMELEKRREKSRKYYQDFPEVVAGLWQSFTDDGEVPELAWLYYTILDKIGMIEMSDKQKREFWEQVQKEEDKRRANLSSLEKIQEKFEAWSDRENRLRNEAREKALMYTFATWQHENREQVLKAVEKKINDNLEILVNDECGL